MKEKELEALKDGFQVYLMSLDDSLVELEKDVASHCGVSTFRLDHSLESLGQIESFLSDCLDEKHRTEAPIELIITRISSYMGEVARTKLHGRWELCLDEDDFDFGLPCVGNLSGYPKGFAWCPIQVVFNFRRDRRPMLLRSATEAIVDLDY
jgi:hypothetical protein